MSLVFIAIETETMALIELLQYAGPFFVVEQIWFLFLNSTLVFLGKRPKSVHMIHLNFSDS